MAPADDIAVVGYSFKLPQGVEDDTSFWETLSGRRNLMTDCPRSRINSDSFVNDRHHNFRCRRGHFISEDVSVFDAPFFSVTAKEAAAMDPMQRWTLETTYRAFEKAGIPAESLRGSRTAVFSASMVEDYGRMIAMDPDNAERTAVTGSSVACVIPNRISWYFDLRGPSIHVNTACSSSLSAVDMACKTLHAGDASCAVVTGSNLLLDPAMFQALSAQKFLSPDGICQSFDHRANGYGRGEGIIAIVLKPVTLAVQDGDMIRAIIRSTGSNQDGHTPGLTQPSPQAQEDLIRHVYKQAGLSLDETRYVEAHGTGTAVGDPIEMKAIGRSFRKCRSAQEPLYVGSVKANIGHLEGASGLAGILKCIMILEKGIIPPNALLEKVNPAIDVDFYHTTVPSQSVVWPSSGLRRVSVNSFGFGGSNTHVVLDDALHYLTAKGLSGNHNTVSVSGSDEAPATALATPAANGTTHTNGTAHTNGGSHTNGSNPDVKCSTGMAKLLVWSAANEKAVKRTLEAYDTFYRNEVSGNPAKLDRLAFTLATRRSKMLWRTCAVVIDGPQSDEHKTLSPSKPVRSSADVGLAFVFTGQGAQYVDMGWDLVQYPVFLDMLKRIDGIYSSLGCTWSLFDELRCAENINKPEYSQPLSTAVQIALVELLRSFGIGPKAVVGHSSGEIAAAYTIGGLSLESACKVSYFRGQLAGKLRAANSSSPGAMISINLAEGQVPEYLCAIQDGNAVDVANVACVNSPLNCTLSGPEEAIDRIKAQADKDGIFAQKLRTGVGYHSPSMLAIADEYLSLMGSLEPAPQQDAKAAALIPMVSSVSGQVVRAAELSKAQYWVDNMVSPVRFADAVQVLTQGTSKLKFGVGSITDLVEIGPHPALRRPVLDTVGQTGNRKRELRYASALQRSRSAVQTALDLVGQLFCLGHSVSVSAVNRQSADGKVAFLVDCPEYPFDHSQQYWSESRISRDFRLRGLVQGETLGVRVSDWNPLEPRWRNFLSIESTPWIRDYMVDNKVLFPAAGMLLMAIEAVQQMAPDDRTVSGYLVEAAEFLHLIPVQEAWEDRVETQVHLRPIKRKQGDEEATRFETAVYSYSRDEWTECLRASIQIDYQATLATEGRQEKCSADQDIRNRFAQLTEVNSRPVDSHILYDNAAEHGLRHGEWFQLVQDVRWDGKATAVARVDVTKSRYQTSSLVHPAILEQALHVLRASAGQQPAANIPIRLADAWFAASGWQHPSTSSIKWLASSTSSLRDTTTCGESGAAYALADDGTILCTMHKVVTAGQVKDVQDNERRLLYSIDWKPQLSLLEPEQLALTCRANTFSRDETTILSSHAQLCSTLDLVAARVLKRLDNAKVPKTLRRHVDWIEHHVGKMPGEKLQEADHITDAEVEAQLCQVESELPAWKLYTTCARRLQEMLAGEVDPLQVVFESNLADIFYADVFQYLCADGRLGTILDLASHENPALRILEVGAGTGGMTGHVIAALQERERKTGAPAFAEYTYTDISPAFFERATGRWSDLQEQGRMTFKTLDLDRDTETQGFKPQSYDIVVAACVLHATPDLEATIRNVRKTLKPGGRLVLLEVINADDIATNFMAGLLPGWWVAREGWRPHSAAVPESLWDRCLRDNGFSGNDVVIRDYENDPCHIMSIIVSTALEDENVKDALSPQTSRIIAVVENQAAEQQQDLAKSVLTHIDSGNSRPSAICGFSRSQLADTLKEVTRDDTIICLAEMGDAPLLANLSDERLACLQLLVRQPSKLLWATATGTNNDQYPHRSIAQGFLRSIRAEQPDSHIVMVSIEDETDQATYAKFISKVFETAFDSPSSKELEYTVRDGLLMTGRAIEDVTGNTTLRSLLSRQLQQRAWSEGPALQLSFGTRGSLDSFRFVQDATHESELGPHEVEIEAKAWGLSYRDVRVASGVLDVDQEMQLGSDCAGTVARIGPACDSSLKLGDRVCMVQKGCMRKYPRALETSIAKLPDTLPFESVTAALVPGMTAKYALNDVARLEQGDKILIHSAASSVGQMAIQIAQIGGADVFATVSSAEEEMLLKNTLSLPGDRIFYSQATSFAPELMLATRGSGVDVVFNSVPNEDAMSASFQCIASCGRAIEAEGSSRDASFTLPRDALERNITFSALNLMALKPKVTAKLLRDTVQLLADGKIRHPQPTVFNASEAEKAFRQLESGGKLGRTVICPKPEDVVPQFIQEQRSWSFNQSASYLIAGGFGGLGRAIVRWMVDRGAKHLIIPSRSGASSGTAQELIGQLAEEGVNIFAPKCDVSSETSLAAVLDECSRTMPPIKGCINAAMVLQDATFQAMAFAQWDLAIRSKVQTSWNLHRLLPRDVDFFILLSSLAGVIGQMASANYAGGCSFQDAIARHRVAQGQRGLSIDIGWMRNVGIIAETGAYQRQRLKANDMQQIDEVELFSLLSLCCDPSSSPSTAPQGQILFGLRTPRDILIQGQTPPALLDRPLFGTFSYIPNAGAGAGQPSGNRHADQEAAALFRQSSDSGERVQIVLQALAAKLARAMSMSCEDVEPNKPLSAYGVDSLMAIDLRNWIGKDFGAPVAVVDIMGGVPIADVADLVVAKSTVGKDS